MNYDIHSILARFSWSNLIVAIYIYHEEKNHCLTFAEGSAEMAQDIDAGFETVDPLTYTFTIIPN